jgi:magnesium chelatase family protein
VPRPGEISLAHRGVLFLDEVAEFPSQTLEVLRQPLEDRQISISRAQGSSVFPAHFTLIAAMNPCPCGYYNIPKSPKDCTCNPGQISRYQKKLSGPFLDRFDLFVDIAPVKIEKLQDSTPAEESLKIRERVQNARNLQTERFQKEAITTNSEMGVRQIEKHCPLNSESQAFLKEAIQKYQLSARGYHRILKVSRTIADLEAQAEISLKNLAEALQLRQKVAAT